MPPWQGGGEMILNVTFEETTFQEPPHRFEAGTPDISGAIGLGTALDFIEGLGRGQYPRARRGADRLRRRPAVAHPRPAACSAPASVGSAFCPSTSPACIRTMSRPCSTGITSRCAPGIIALSRCWKRSAIRRRPAPRSASTTTQPISMRSPRRSRRHRRCFGVMDLRDLYQDIILDHGRHPRNFRAIEHPTHFGAGPQPAVRRPGHGLCRPRRRPDRRCQLRGARLRDLDRGGLADDRGAEGQDGRRGEGIVRDSSTRG